MQDLKNHKKWPNNHESSTIATAKGATSRRFNLIKALLTSSLLFSAMQLSGATAVTAETQSNTSKKPTENLLYRESLAFIEAKDYKAAVNSLTKFLLENTSSSEGYFLRGKAFHELNVLDKASSDYNQSIKINPESFKSHNNLGLIYGQNKKFDLAKKSFTKAISTNPQSKEAFNNRGVARAATGDSYGAISDFTQSIQIDGQYLEPLLNRSFVYEMQGKLDKACDDWKAASLIGSRNAKIWHKAQCKI